MRTKASGAPNRRKPGGIFRTLDVLKALNMANGSTVGEIHAITGISRPALYRILGEFLAAGYVSRDDRGGFHLTHLVCSLSDGFREGDRIADIARPVLEDLQRKVLWPADLATYFNHAMHLRISTRRQSALVIDRSAIGLRMPVFSSAVGLAYVAHCSSMERESIIEALQRSDEPENQIARDSRRVAQLIRQTRAEGYGARVGATPGIAAAETGAIAIPVWYMGNVTACIAITFFSKVFGTEDAANRYLTDMKLAAARIEKKFESEVLAAQSMREK